MHLHTARPSGTNKRGYNSQLQRMTVHPRWAGFHAPVITFVILGFGVVAPSAANASCGDYVVYTSPPDARPARDHGPVRCQGLSCSRIPPPAPIPQAPPLVRVHADQAVSLQGEGEYGCHSTTRLPVEPAPGRPVRRAPDV